MRPLVQVYGCERARCMAQGQRIDGPRPFADLRCGRTGHLILMRGMVPPSRPVAAGFELGPYDIDRFRWPDASPPAPAAPDALDAAGVPMFDPGRVRGAGPPVYHPIVIIQYGLRHHGLLSEGRAGSRAPVVACARWLVDHAEWDDRRRFLRWPYPFPLKWAGLEAGWWSGMAQGQALSLLLRSEPLLDDPRVIEVARQAARSLHYDLRDGGAACDLDADRAFIEELPYEPAPHILNGCLYALLGLHEFARITGDADAERQVQRVVAGVDAVLDRFDTGYWSRYALGLGGLLAKPGYHLTHMSQLWRLGALLDRPRWRRTADRWAG